MIGFRVLQFFEFGDLIYGLGVFMVLGRVGFETIVGLSIWFRFWLYWFCIGFRPLTDEIQIYGEIDENYQFREI